MQNIPIRGHNSERKNNITKKREIKTNVFQGTSRCQYIHILSHSHVTDDHGYVPFVVFPIPSLFLHL